MAGASETGNSPSAGQRTSALRWLTRIAVALVLLVLIAAGLFLAAVQTESGTRTAWQLAQRIVPGSLTGELVGGTLKDGIELRNVVYEDASKIIKIDRLEGRWRLTRSPLMLTIPSLRLGKVDVTMLASPPTETTFPQEIRLPLAFDLQRATIEQVTVHQEAATTVYSDISLSAGSDRLQHRLTLDRAVTPFGDVQGMARLNGTRPFALDSTIALDTTWQEKQYQLNARLGGSLEALGIRINATGDKLNGLVTVDATPFAAVPFRSAKIDVSHLDPHSFNDSAPQADLGIQALLTPVATGSDSREKLNELAVQGPVTITNGKPGAIDAGLLPLISASTDVTLDAHVQKLSQVSIRLLKNASFTGGGEMRRNEQDQMTGQFSLQGKNIDLHALHTKLRPSQLSGPVELQVAGETQQVELKLSDADMSIEGQVELEPAVITLHAARLQAGDAKLNLAGKLERDAPAQYFLKGELADFNPALFMASLEKAGAKPAINRQLEASINTEFGVQGALRPELNGIFTFDIRDSTYQKLPMTGGGTLEWAGQRLLPSDLKLSIAGNNMALKGSFGEPSDKLSVNINAPRLDRLGFGLAGLLQVNGTAAGSVERPVVDATFWAEKLVFGEHRVDRLNGNASTQGVPGTDPNARIRLALDASGIRSTQIRLDKLNANINGTYASHTIDLSSTGKLRGQDLALTLAAQGKLQEQANGLAWNGQIRKFANQGIPRISMESPLAVSVAAGDLELGSTRLTIERALIDLKHLTFRDNLIRSEGSMSALDIGHLLALRKEITGETAPVKTDIVIDGKWDFSVSDSASGFLQFARRRGDISFAGPARETSLGLSALSLRADLAGSQVKVGAEVDAKRIGSANANGTIVLQNSNGMLTMTPESTISGNVSGLIPRLQSIASLAGPRIALDGSVAINLNAKGKLGEPIVSGTVNGDKLALTLFDQGVRLRDGRARIVLDNNVAELREMVFRGGDGTLRASGRIPLDRSNPDLSIAIVAEQLQLLASPSGTMTVSGKATAVNIEDKLRVTGKFIVDQALFSLPEKSAPKLSDDVVIIRDSKSQQAKVALPGETPAGPFTPYVNVELDLGKNFRFVGSGADLRLAGTLEVQSAPGETPEVLGTVRIVEGTYEAFGAKLAIERGILNFQGEATNPNVNILAMRRGQEVAAGVNVTGTIQDPRVQLVSEPNVSEEEKLSWLIFGRSGGGNEAGQAQAAARGAALGLLNNFGGERIADRFGLDELSIGTSEYGLENRQVVNLGKEITDRLYVGYEQSLAGAESVLRLTYQLTSSWSVVLRGGSISSLDLFFSRRFDHFGRR